MSIIPDYIWSKPDSVLATDACLDGAGGVFWPRREYYHFSFPRAFKCQEHHINVLELVGLVVSIKLWGSYLKGQRVLLHCDNESTVTVVNSGRCKDALMLAWLRELSFELACSQCIIKCSHVRGQDNRLPDLLSRWDSSPLAPDTFRSLAPGEWKEVEVPAPMLTLRDLW